MLCRNAFRRLSAQAAKRPAANVTALTDSLRRLGLSGGSLRVPAYSRLFATGVRPVGRPKKGGAVTAKAPSRRTPGKPRADKAAKSTKPKPKKAAKRATKAAPKKKKKVLTEEQKEKAAQRKRVVEIRELKKASLIAEEPAARGKNAWVVFHGEHLPKGSTVETTRELIKENGTKFKNLTPAEREHYNHLTNEINTKILATHKSWVESHTPEEIRQANLARARLRLLSKQNGKPKPSSYARTIADERQVKRPINSYTIFYLERQKSGDLKDISLAESARLVSSEWKALSQSEREKYDELYNEALLRYKDDFKATYGYEPTVRGSRAAAATANA